MSLALNKKKINDLRLKKLVALCLKRNNYEKLSKVSYILIRNIINEIGIRLYIRPISKKISEEKSYQYMVLINKIIFKNFKVSIFKEDILKHTKYIETIFFNNKHILLREHICKLIEIYYELRKIEIPILSSKIDFKNVFKPSDFLLSSNLMISKNKKIDQYQSFLLNYINEIERQNQMKLNANFNSSYFKKAIYFQQLKNYIKNKESKKIIIKGNLRKSIDYRHSLDGIIGNLFLGGFILCVLLGLAIVVETMIYLELSYIFGVLSLLFFGVGILFFLIYYLFFFKKN